jgi:hypothetical protein
VLLRGRPPDGASWAGVGAALAPGAPVTAPALAAGATPTLTGTTGPGEPRVLVAPRLVLQDGAGLRTPCDAPPVPLDGRPHPLPACGPAAGERRVVALGLRVAADPAGGPAITDRSPIAVTLTVPGAAGPGVAGPWSVSPTGVAPQQVADARAGPIATTPGGTAVRLTAAVRLTDPATPAELVATAFEPPGPVPVAVSRRVSDVLRAPVGARLALTVGTTPVPVVVAAVVPTVPSAPGAAALLADVDLLSRALLTAGELAPPADAWWVGGPRRPDAAARAAALGLGEVTGREATAEQLAHGPLRAGLPAALTLLVPGAVLLLLAGVLLHVTSDVEARALEVARLRGLGLSRRSVLGGLLAQHGALLALLLVAGAAVGALASRAVAPLLVTSDVGGAPVPAVLARWPWAAEGALLALLVAGCAGAVALVVAIQVRRADAAHLRVGP